MKECKQCEERIAPWLTEHMEAWHGPKANWNAKIREEFHNRCGLLMLFTKDFHFEPQTQEARG